MEFPAKAPVVGIPISTTSYEEVMATISARPEDRGVSVAVCNVHSVMSARRDAKLRDAVAGAEIATPDGVPLVWALRWTGHPEQQRVYGPELMRRALVDSASLGWKHYLYGSSRATLDRLRKAISEFAPDAEIVGAVSPPFRELTPDEHDEALARITASGADVVWVGLGMPKQELWMHHAKQSLPGIALLGVGAAFDFLAGTVKQAPAWMQRTGFEWLYRLLQEPRRLWRRYIWNNPAYLMLLAWQVLRSRIGKRR
ncbi:MAG: WecB/TagA/CpsF family glycosyltransferase [Acidimicrobiia bacterium]|nr:WecB/TagA/CpsF family glycosyltransferase [Acidimicrobiia bacterium]